MRKLGLHKHHPRLMMHTKHLSISLSIVSDCWCSTVSGRTVSQDSLSVGLSGVNAGSRLVLLSVDQCRLEFHFAFMGVSQRVESEFVPYFFSPTLRYRAIISMKYQTYS